MIPKTATPNATASSPDMDAIPPEGGSYLRQADGSLIRTDGPEAVTPATSTDTPKE